MKQLKSIYIYIFEAVFLAPWFAYALLIIIDCFVMWLLIVRTDEPTSGFAALGAVILSSYLFLAVFILLSWRKVHRKSYVFAMKLLSVLWIIPAVVLPITNYPSQVQYETERRDGYIADNEEYARNPHPNFDTSVAEEWIKSDETIRQEALQYIVDDILNSLKFALAIVLPMLAIRAVLGGKKYGKADAKAQAA